MTADDANFAWEFDVPPGDDDTIRCPECNEPSPLAEWTEGEVYCEDCGSHSAMVCPRCDERFDHVHGPTFEVIRP